ncbi:hypothetical protein MPC4_1040002 [Methylocella tundrae]|uniref:Uncharacterized protein n=1 Tax=Methylocella tundrae TaxID=227605 RepID=A0A8B6M1J1_METTU|nr:hypothetical protein MPC4_1040002 [Methylocella tundrae]
MVAFTYNRICNNFFLKTLILS